VLCDQAIALRDADENVYTYVPAGGLNYVFDDTTSTWASVTPILFSGKRVTQAYVNGRTFICYEQDRIIEYDPALNVFNSVTIIFPVGTAMTDIRGIGGASNYLVLYTDLNILWGSPLDILDFSSIDAGAGQQTPIDIKGAIISVVPISGGFVAYTTRNAIGATYTYDASKPFIFKEIIGCGGISSGENVTLDANDIGQYVWGTNGLQLVNLTGAAAIFPEVTDFLVGKQVESWNPSTKRVDLVESGSVQAVKVAFLAGRYLVVSYGSGTTDYSYALVYDESLKRWGKLKITHVDAFMYPYPASGGAITYDIWAGTYDTVVVDYATLGIVTDYVIPAKQGIAFLKTTGEIQLMESSFTQQNTDSVAIFGHIAYKHDDMVTVQTVELDGLKNTSTPPTVTLISSLDGLARDTTTAMYNDVLTGNYRRYRCRYTSRNHDIVVEGTFVLSTLLADVTRHGYR
jgi:hypothetical protein